MASPALRSAAERAALSQGSGTASNPTAGAALGSPSGAALPPGSAPTVTLPQASLPTQPLSVGQDTGSGSSAPPGPGGATGPSGRVPTGPAAPTGAASKTGGNGGATDVGVTATTITVGNVATISGPVPGLFRGASAGVQAYFAYINSQGGVNGRQLKVDAHDDGFQCAQNQAQTADAAKTDFAFVGSFSLFDNCGATALPADVPDLSEAVSSQRAALKSNYSVQPQKPGAATGPFLYYKSTFADSYQAAALLYYSTPATTGVIAGVKAAMQSLGYQIKYERSVGATDSNFTSDVLRMRSDGVKFVELLFSPGMIAEFMQAAGQQNFAPVVSTLGQGYDLAVLKQGGSAVNGMYTAMPTAPFFNASEASIPAVALYQTWMQRAAAGVPLDLFSVYGWTEAQLFVDALRASGPKATRAGVLQALSAVKSFNGDGLIATGYPATRQPTICYVLVKVVNGQFQRTDTPAGGYRCDGTWQTP
ncbi:ABC transporter substrate-binding protein [Humibacter sp.]|uniref:ABC transporter substrate-binding protein n=1 Tax=Humibacter sp. TaxID=1940291 RepID=UPI002CF47421|nr:ABC transporter substrate-binding protein [Humibacter sp.]HVX09181.1 ABC transporter substrate-binding protein [Humibacter sp.]